MPSAGQQWLCFVGDDGSEGREEFEAAVEAARQHLIPYKTVPAEELPVNAYDLKCEDVNDNSVYVLRSFGTDVHRKLQQRKSRVVGPMCVITTLQERTCLPEARDCNVFTLAMRGAVVCCTNVGEREDRDMLHNLVTLMGGSVMRSLTQSVTHLLAGEVGSAKYTVARSLKLPILLPSWVEQAWEVSRKLPVNATGAEFVAKHPCPSLKGVCVCVTGVDAVLRKNIRSAAEENGGQYCGELSMESTTHLIAHTAGGEKYKHARLWGIPCVKPTWIFKCVETRAYVNPSDFEIEPGSTAPLKLSGQDAAGSDTQGPDASRKRKRVADSIENPSAKRSMVMARSSSSGFICSDVPPRYADLAAVQSSNSAYLDGCKILLHDYGGAMLDLLRRVINCGGGTRFNQLNATVSHIILERPSSDIRQRLEAIQGVRPHVVTSSWLLESCRCESRVVEEKYVCCGMEIEEKQPSATDSSMLRQREVTPSTVSMPPPDLPCPSTEKQNDKDAGNILAQYLPTAEASGSSSSSRSSLSTGNNVATNRSTSQTAARDALFSSLPPFHVRTGDSVCNALVTKLLQKDGGKLCSDPSAESYSVCGLADERTAGSNQVTMFWIEQCILAGEILAPSSDPLFEPNGFDSARTFMRGAVLSLSQYDGQLRTQLSKLAICMGATVQDHFVRKESKGLKASTHLLCESAAGSKYAAAQRWSLPAVDHRWLVACSQQRRLVPGEDFQVGAESEKAPSCTTTPARAAAQQTTLGKNGHAHTAAKRSTPVASSTASTTPSARTGVIGNHLPFQPSFDTADVVAALQSPAVVATKRANRSSGVGLAEMFQNNLASAVGVCSAATATENESTDVAKEPVTATPAPEKKSSPPASNGRRSMRRGKKQLKTPLDGVTVQPVTSSSQRLAAAEPSVGAAPAAAITASATTDSPKGVPPVKVEATNLASPQKENLPVVLSPDAKQSAATAVEIPAAGTLEVREAFEREMEGLMALTSSRNSNGRSSVRRSTRINRSSSVRSPATERTSDDSGMIGSALTHFGSKSSLSGSTIGAPDLGHGLDDGGNGVESSQNEVITYDDPNGRLERERIIAELKEAPDLPDEHPTPATSSMSETVAKVFPVVTETAASNDAALRMSSASNPGVATTPTPPVPVPMIAALRPAAKTRPPLATEDLAVSQAKSRAAQLKFHLTALSQAEKADYIVLIEKLGGKVYDTMFFSTSSTHLIVGKPSRSEKYLGALASGKWLLRKSFMEASREAGHFVEESSHEWGSQLHRQGKPEPIELAAQRWRVFLHDERLAQQLDGAPSRVAVGAFTDWRVLLAVSRDKQAGLKRLLEAGGAKIVKVTPPFNNLKGVTHAFIEVSKAPAGSIDYPKLKEASIHCCRPEFIAEYLIQDPAPDVEKYYLSDVYSKRQSA